MEVPKSIKSIKLSLVEKLWRWGGGLNEKIHRLYKHTGTLFYSHTEQNSFISRKLVSAKTPCDSYVAQDSDERNAVY
jgi:hypothetical protein